MQLWFEDCAKRAAACQAAVPPKAPIGVPSPQGGELAVDEATWNARMGICSSEHQGCQSRNGIRMAGLVGGVVLLGYLFLR